MNILTVLEDEQEFFSPQKDAAGEVKAEYAGMEGWLWAEGVNAGRGQAKGPLVMKIPKRERR